MLCCTEATPQCFMVAAAEDTDPCHSIPAFPKLKWRHLTIKEGSESTTECSELQTEYPWTH